MPQNLNHSTADIGEQQERNLRVFYTLSAVFFLFLILIFRLFWLQVVKYEDYFRRSEENRIRKTIVTAERGYIYDKNGQILVRNRPSYNISILPYQVDNRDSVYNRLMRVLDTNGQNVFDPALLEWAFERGKYQRFRPLRILEDATDMQVAFIEERSELFPGVVSYVESRRDYPYGTMASHALGYTGEISEQQLKDSVYIEQGYALGDRLGQKGLEKEYEHYFRGHDGVKYVEVNAYGREIGLVEEMQYEDAVAGHNIHTTLDWNLQKVAEDAVPDTVKGAVVVLNPQNGEILAMLSSPRINPNIFSLNKKALKKSWAEVALDSARPLNNRAIQGTYPPGSIFKFITAAAGLESEVIDSYTRFPKPCTGGFYFGRRYQRCWLGAGHGYTNVVSALRESCNVFFYQCGLELGMDKINDLARKYGLGRRLGVDLPGEKQGLLMDSVTYNKRFERYGWKWSRGQILNLAIGQGELVTPLQIASFFGAMAYGKGLYRPHLVKEVRSSDGELIKMYPITKISEAKLRAENQDIILHSMEEVVSGVRGTGRRAQIRGVKVGAKTGSAENPQGDKTHAWFAAVAPLESPTISVAVLLENTGSGAATAGPIAAKILQAYFSEKNDKTGTNP
ncbi:MAG: penicillin-binding protein 2 [Fibrobacter sp.]|nr:penicillin-binding protein 2 [Fibrobacter sp.]